MASILGRKRDLAYLLFFLIHIPIMYCIDLAPLWPEGVRPQFMSDIRKYYIETYQDRFWTSPPAWFTMYTWMELFYHTPLSIWAIGALLRGESSMGDDPRLPIHLLVFAVQVAITTSTCIADFLSWAGYRNSEKMELGKLYVPYLAFSVFMGVDMCTRLTTTLSRKLSAAEKKAL